VGVLLISPAENNGNCLMLMNLICYDLHTWLTRTKLRTGFFSGQRACRTKTMAGNGRMVPVFATMTGLSAEELPPKTCPSVTSFMELPELCIGGSDIWADGTGTIAFARKDACNKDWDSAERRFFEEHDERVFHPFV
jgi:hypothetical protein